MASSSPRFLSFLDPLTGADTLRLEKARLEAFLDAMPGHYCGFAQDGAVIYSPGFCRLLGLDTVASLADIQARLSTSDAAALEGQWDRLERTGQGFTLTARHADKERLFLRLSGTRGIALDGRDRFDILWIEDITAQHGEQLLLQQKLQQAETEQAVFQAMIDSLPRPFWRRGAETELQWVNRAYAAIYDKSPGQIVAEQVEIPTAGKTKAPPPKDMARAALAAGEAQSERSHVILKGQRKWMLLNEVPLPGNGGTVGFALDLTREEEIERELERERKSIKAMLEQLRTGIIIYGGDERVAFYNSSYAQMWGLEDSWLNTRPKLGEVFERLRESRRLPEQADYRKYKEEWVGMFTSLIDPHEEMLYLPDGKTVRVMVVPHTTGDKGGLMFTFEDVTSNLELESSYNTLQAVQKETLDNLAEGIAVFGGDGRLKFFNPAFAGLWKFNPEDLAGEPHISRLADRAAPFFAAEEWEAQKRVTLSLVLEREGQEGRFALNDGRTIDYTTVPLPDGGKLISYFDVTDTVKVQTALEEKNAALEAAERLKLDFLANVSYQLRTPLSAIMGFAEILTNEYFAPITDKQREYTQGIEQAGQRLLSLIDDILDLSTIEAGYMELHKSPIDAAAMLRGLHDLTAEWTNKEKISVVLDIAGGLDPIDGDERRLKQVMLNLLRNAINHTPEGGIITLSAAQDDGHIRLTVADTGNGISTDLQERIFQPFERGETARDSGGRGAGLGLSLVRNIVELHGGTVTLDSRPGDGATFSILLPRA